MTWRVQISGEKVDLEALSISFKDDDRRLVVEDDKYFLESLNFESTSDSAEVLKMAIDLAAVLSGVARLAYGARIPLMVGHIERVRPDGVKDVFVQLTGPPAMRALLGNLKVDAPGASEAETETADQPHRWIRVADEDEAVSKALRLFGSDAKDWVGLYRLFEVIQQDVGEIAAEWATAKSIERFRRTANSPTASGDLARHGKERTQPPKNSMDLFEARALIEVILHCWMRAKDIGSR